MSGMLGTSDGMWRVGVTYVLTMLLIAAGGIRSARIPRVVLLGRPTDVHWDRACGCSTSRFRVAAVGTIRVIAAGGDLLTRDGHIVVLGHLTTPQVVVSDVVIELGSMESDPRRVIDSLRDHRPLAVIVLLLLASYGWKAISFTAGAFAAAVACTTSAIALNCLAFWFNVGVADLGWAATLALGACGGWHAARHFDPVLLGKAQAAVMSVATALSFRDMAGVIGGIAGMALPVLSRRVTLGFLLGVAALIMLDLPDITLQIAAGSSLAIAGFDRWRTGSDVEPRTAPTP